MSLPRTSPARWRATAPSSRRASFDHGLLERFVDAVDIPVVNLLSDRAHPCQALADLLTLREALGSLEGRRMVFVGDGNNVAASLAFAAALSGLELVVASPPGYELDDDVAERASNLGGVIELVADPYEAVADADAVYTDVWTSMGQEDETRAAARGLHRLSGRRRAHGRGRAPGDLPALPAGAPR